MNTRLRKRKAAAHRGVRHRPQRERLAEEHEDDAGDHGVAHEPVRAAHDERAGRIPGRERSLPVRRESPERPNEEPQPHGEERDARDLDQDGAGRRAPASEVAFRRAIHTGMRIVTVNGSTAIAKS